MTKDWLHTTNSMQIVGVELPRKIYEVLEFWIAQIISYNHNLTMLYRILFVLTKRKKENMLQKWANVIITLIDISFEQVNKL